MGMFIEGLAERHIAELRRHLRNHKWESTDEGLLVPEMGLTVGGVYGVQVADGPWEFQKNLVVTEGLNYNVAAALANGSQIPTWYVALFSGDVVVPLTWTAANWVANATEFTGYDEGTRQEFVEGSVAAGAVNNLASVATFTITGPGAATIRGGALVSNSVKSSTTGKLFSAARFGSDKTVDAGEQLRVSYSLTAANPA